LAGDSQPLQVQLAQELTKNATDLKTQLMDQNRLDDEKKILAA